jgi:hypothetical protein
MSSFDKKFSLFASGVLATPIVGVGIFFIGLASCSPLAGGDLAIGYPHDISGEITKEPTTRYVRGPEGAGGTEKVAITVSVESVPETLQDAHSGGELIIECHSTRCTQIQKGETHSFACIGVGRFFEPNVAVCKHVSKL